MLLTLPGFRRSLLPFTLYSMWTRRSRFSWRGQRDGGRLSSDGRKRRQRMKLSLFVNEREGKAEKDAILKTESGGGGEIEGACVFTVCQIVSECVCVCVCVSVHVLWEREKKAGVINWGGKPKWGSTVRGERDSGGRVNYLHVLLMLEGGGVSNVHPHTAPFVMIHLGLSDDIIFPRPLR